MQFAEKLLRPTCPSRPRVSDDFGSSRHDVWISCKAEKIGTYVD